MVEIAQADREAAAEYYYSAGGSQEIARQIREGGKDGWFRVQAFAEHRLATRPAPDGESVAVMNNPETTAIIPAKAQIATNTAEGPVSGAPLAHPPRNDAVVEALRETGRFLLDRLDELDWSLDMEDFAREHAGHVDPAIARFRDALAALKQGEPR